MIASGHRTAADPTRPATRTEAPMPARILVVDDDPNIQRLLTYTLRQEGYEVTVAADGQEGVQRWSSEGPDLVLLDVMLPKLDGYQAAARIRSEEPAGAHVPIIMLTAGTDVEQRVRGLRAGADDYQIKPFHPAELLARIKSLLARFAPHDAFVGRPPLGRVQAYYGAKGGVGTTTITINAGIALHRELGRRVVLVDGNLQFGDHRVFLDLGLDKKSIVDIVTAPNIDQELLRSVIVKHDSGVDLLLAPPSPESADLVVAEQHHMARIVEQLRQMYDYVLVDIDKRLDDNNLDVITAADTVFVVMTADLSCLKNVRLILETMTQLGIARDKVQLVLNRSNAFTGINVKNAEAALKRRIDHQIVNEYRGAISALNSGGPFMASKPDSLLSRSVLDFVRSVDKSGPQPAPAPQLTAATQVPVRT
jgi:pilus assembly protein CpaE